jgi:hypothetical protein
MLLWMLVVAGLLLVSTPPTEAHPHGASGAGQVVAAVLPPIGSSHCPSGHGSAGQSGLPSHHCAPAHAGCCVLPAVHVGTFVARVASAWPETEIISAGLALAPPLPPPIASPDV